MKKRQTTSHDILSKSQSRRLTYLLGKTLQMIDDSFPESNTSINLKHSIKTVFNDVIRSQRDELEDYSVEYTPLRFKDDNILCLSSTMLSVINNIKFELSPARVLFFSNGDKFRPLNAIRSEIDAGIISYCDNNSLLLEVVGLYDCINKVIPVLDRFILSDKDKVNYIEWRRQLIALYRHGEGKNE